MAEAGDVPLDELLTDALEVFEIPIDPARTIVLRC